MSQRLTALVTASAIPAVRWYNPAKHDAHDAISHFRHYSMHIDVAISATQANSDCGLLMLVSEKELRTIVYNLGSCSRFITTPFRQIRQLSITVKLL